MTAHGYVFDQAWTLERTRLTGLEVGAGAGTVARRLAPMPKIVAAWGRRPG